MDYKIAGISLYYIISWFFIYSFLGWAWESAYVSIKNKKLVNRGFINGPLCTIYGAGAVTIYLLLRPFEKNLALLYLGGVITATALEYVTGWIMETVFHTRWWDYSNKKFNLHGYISLVSSLLWGAFSILLFKLLQPFVSWITSLYPQSIGEVILAVVSVLYGIDFGISAYTAFGLSKTFGKVEDMLEELISYMENSRLYETREEIREKLEGIRGSIKQRELLERLSARREEFIGRFESVIAESPFGENSFYNAKRQELEQRLDDFSGKYMEIRSKQNVFIRRMVHAYPNLKNGFKRYREKHQDKRTR
ncbi:MAG: hypothetical protein KH330_02500 [Clostridiales bacterium]|nr:hypothetical protein [Clostridiales bacterium]